MHQFGSDLGAAERRLERDGSLLSDRRASLEAERRVVDLEAAARDDTLQSTEMNLSAEAKEVSRSVARVQRQRDVLSRIRFQMVRKALSRVNNELSRLFRRATRFGDCALLYSLVPQTLWADGVTFEAKPPRGRWRSFTSLSGGQQALCSLCVSDYAH